MEYVVARSRRTRHAHHHHQVLLQQQQQQKQQQQQQQQLVSDLRLPPPTTQLPTSPVQLHTITTTTTTQQRQRRMDLEHEVAEMKRRLCNEQAVHDVLERVLLPTATLDGRRSLVLNIPAFIPPKTKELLAEVLLVEEEIARLETQIHNMKAAVVVNGANAAGNGSTTKETVTTYSRKPPPGPDQVVVAPDRSMFFINQAMAMNGDYLKRHLAADDDGKVKSSLKETTTAAMSPKLNSHMPPRNSLDQKPPKESPAKREEHQQKTKIHPNKLSERIVKCLVCIFIRLLRSSRVAETGGSNLARSGNLTSVQQHGHGGSFRIDTGLVTRSDVADQRGGQQDHYGIFAIEDSVVRDIGPYKNLVRFTSSSLDLRAFSASPLLTKLREMLEALQKVDLRFLTQQQKLAFWLNTYNTCIMHGILQHGMPSSSEKLLALKNKATINVSGDRFNALVIENFILRQPSSVREELWKCEVEVEEQQVRGSYGLSSSDPNIAFALCCGTRSSPSLRIYKAERVTTELEKAKLEYLQAALVVTSTAARRAIMIPGLMQSNMHDFAKDTDSLVRWIIDQLPTSWSLRKSMVDCLRSSSSSGHIDLIPYDYEFQYLLPSM